MSTKILHGYRTRVTSLPRLWRDLTGFGEVAQLYMRRAVTRGVAACVANAIDNARLGLPLPEWMNGEASPLFAANEYVVEQHRAVYATRHRNPEFDFGCRVWVYPSTADTLMILDAEHAAYHELWKDVCGFKPFRYWNNTDRPKGIGQRAWARRGDRWRAAVPPDPKGTLAFVAVGEWLWFVPDRAQVLAALPKFPDRVDAAAGCILRDRRCAGKLKGNGVNFMKVLRDHTEWLKTPAGAAALDRERKRVASRLQKITPEMLLQELKGGGE